MKSKQIPTSLPKGIGCQNGDVSQSQVVEALGGNVEEFVKTVVKLVRKIPTSTWEIWTGNYVEFLSSVAVGTEHVGAFLQNFELCLLNLI